MRDAVTAARGGVAVVRNAVMVARGGMTVVRNAVTVARCGMTVVRNAVMVARSGVTVVRSAVMVARSGVTVVRNAVMVARSGVTVVRRGAGASGTAYAEPSIADYAERTAAQQEWWKAQNGRQGGDPAKLARALITIASEKQPPRRFIAGADAIATAEQKVADLKAQIESYRELSTSLAFDERQTEGG
ncbi:MAG TPA: hypothetical protein VH988_09555 [Thermoanaerobaculia bacterium]|nr:hypothetical protein [Thermoanaerobaculia bacterium]